MATPPDGTPEARQAALKSQGNREFTSKNYAEAIKLYTEGIEIGIPNHLLHGNRSAAYFQIGDFDAAVKDAEVAVTLEPSWTKGYLRLGQALAELRPLDAIPVFKAAYERDPSKGVHGMLVAAITKAAKLDATTPVESVATWEGVFDRQEARLRLCSLAHFWNLCKPAERLRIVGEFVATLGTHVPGTIDFTEAKMVPLPMENYEGVDMPALWLEFYERLSSDERVSVFHKAWQAARPAEKDLIMADLKHFFFEGKAGDEGDEGEEVKAAQ